MFHSRQVVMVLVVSLLLLSCTSYNRQRGVENTWREIDQSDIVPGATTQSDIVKRLGPPSQIIDLESGLVFYYLSEQTKGGGMILILFNTLSERISYDRAIFFFDREGVLADYAFSSESITYDKP